MSESFRPTRVSAEANGHAGHSAALQSPLDVVQRFLHALAEPDFETAAALMDERITYINVGMPTIHGRRRAIAFLRPLARPGARFEVYVHAIAANGNTVLTERTDVIVWRRLRLQFWVTGRFDVQNGRITLWRDSFDYLDMTKALVRGLAGMVVPALRPRAPESADVSPGRS